MLAQTMIEAGHTLFFFFLNNSISKSFLCNTNMKDDIKKRKTEKMSYSKENPQKPAWSSRNDILSMDSFESDFFFSIFIGGWLLQSSVQFSRSVMSDSLRPMNRSTPGLPVHHPLPEFTQTHVHRVSDAIRPSHPLSSPSPPAPNPSQHQSLFH